jgi:hypothetical protein
MSTTETLPAPESITNKPIATAAKALLEAKATAHKAMRTAEQQRQWLPNSKQEDATADAKLRAEGKPPLQGRPATEKHERAIADAEHEELVAAQLVISAEGDLQAAQREHAAAYATEREKRLTSAAAAFQAALSKLVSTYGEYRASTRLAQQLGDEVLGVGAIQINVQREVVEKLTLAEGASPIATIFVEELLAKFGELGTPQQEITPPKFGIPAGAAENIKRIAKHSHETPAGQRAREIKEAEAEALHRELGESTLAARG